MFFHGTISLFFYQSLQNHLWFIDQGDITYKNLSESARLSVKRRQIKPAKLTLHEEPTKPSLSEKLQ
jgi:hypothetical protein